MGGPFRLEDVELEGGEGGFDLRSTDLGDQQVATPMTGDNTPANGDDDWTDDLLNFGKGSVDGLTLNNAAELGGLGQKAGSWLASLRDNDDLERNVASTGDDDLDAMYDAANKTKAGAAGHTLGAINTALAGTAAPGIGGQAAMGALQGGLSAGGISDYDPYATAGGAVVGGGLGALGGTLRAGAKKVGDFLNRGTSTVTGYNGAEPILSTVTNAQKLTSGLGESLDDAIVGVAQGKINPATQALLQGGTKVAQKFSEHGDLYPQVAQLLASGAGTGAGVARAEDLPPQEEGLLDELIDPQVQIGEAEMIPQVGDIGELEFRQTPEERNADNYRRLRDEEIDMMGAQRVEAPPESTHAGISTYPITETTLRKPGGFTPVDDVAGPGVTTTPLSKPGESGWNVDTGEASIKAYAGLPALTYSVHSVLSSGDAGLPPGARDQLTSAMLSGNQDRVKSTNFKLSQRYPEYARRLQETLDDLNAAEE